MYRRLGVQNNCGRVVCDDTFVCMRNLVNKCIRRMNKYNKHVVHLQFYATKMYQMHASIAKNIGGWVCDANHTKSIKTVQKMYDAHAIFATNCISLNMYRRLGVQIWGLPYVFEHSMFHINVLLYVC